VENPQNWRWAKGEAMKWTQPKAQARMPQSPGCRSGLWPALILLLALGGPGCHGEATTPPGPIPWEARRRAMVQQLQAYGITNATVLAAMGRIPRHEFIPAVFRDPRLAYGDHPCPIGHEQTISQPYIVAYMTERLALRPGEKVLEIGTGSGYQAAVLAECGAQVYTIEIIPELARHAETVLRSQGYANRVQVRAGDGYQGWAEHQPYDSIIVTCAPEEIPTALVDQLREHGRMILPLGEPGDQRLVILTKQAGRVSIQNDLPVRFVPMVHGPEN
jgi:protein-L-isoaspartate(D-aspartate) O-methyltransferase